ncbi:prolipoprotein diacylglyceryl transferase [Nocardioides aurantiacus]|uniref:Prolipoprotein diacylglyceryl transferase n=1 Tax=Nocardioides aurantiacus TaxID=86796 RepID=A0A3N2CXA0_9ACTN|nr:prolipoprotein diacylglyceryl transferase family protein [Nocardioides aurantiacus]ROR92129.1 prolipoprotein diacylglyceryl transferase [Nocardioides aurantiacus]
MFPTLGDLLGVPLPVDTHGTFVALGVAVAVGVFVVEARRRGHTDDRLLVVVTGALVGGALLMRLGTWLQHADLRDNATLVEQWLRGNRSVLGGLVGAWLGVHVAKRLVGYRLRTGDLFAPAVALGMAVGRVGCLLTEPRPGGGTNWSFVPEIGFHVASFAVVWWWLRHRSLPPGELFVWWVAAYGIFRFVIELSRGNEVVWAGLTRPQLFLAVTVPLVLLRIALRWRSGAYRGPTGTTTEELVAR